MNKKYFTFTVISLTIIIGVISLLTIFKENNRETKIQNTNNENKSTSLYKNTKFNYSFKYNINSTIYLQEMGNSKKEESSNVSLNIYNTKGELSVIVMEPVTQNLQDLDSVEYNKLLNLDLKSFAEHFYDIENKVQNPNYPNRKISELKQENIFGKEVYSFVINDNIPDFYGGVDHKYIYLNNKNYKMIIKYPLMQNEYKKILDSFILL